MDENRYAGFNLIGPLMNIVTVIMGVVAAYFLTIQSLKIELSAKAESAVVQTLDKKLNRIEVILTESVVSRDQFYEFTKDIEARLNRIELRLTQPTGEKRGDN